MPTTSSEIPSPETLCDQCGVEHKGTCVRSLQEQGDMQWRHVLALEAQVHNLERGRSLEHEKGTQFVVHVTLDEIRVTWLDRGTEASLIAEEIGVAAAKRLGFKRCSGASLGPGGNEQRWVRS